MPNFLPGKKKQHKIKKDNLDFLEPVSLKKV